MAGNGRHKAGSGKIMLRLRFGPEADDMHPLNRYLKVSKYPRLFSPYMNPHLLFPRQCGGGDERSHSQDSLSGLRRDTSAIACGVQEYLRPASAPPDRDTMLLNPPGDHTRMNTFPNARFLHRKNNANLSYRPPPSDESRTAHSGTTLQSSSRSPSLSG